MHTVYALIDPFNNQARYVGVTSLPVTTRYNAHLSGSTSAQVGEWIEDLRIKESAPALIELETTEDGTEADEAERFWIANLRAIGADLLNIRKGGRPKQDDSFHSVCLKLPPADVITYKRAAKAAGNLSLSAYLRTLLEQVKLSSH